MTPSVFIAIVVFGVFVGFAMGFFGIGGGVFIVPTLVRLAGLAWEEAIGLSLTMMVPTGAIGAWNRARHGEVDYRLGLTVFLGSIPGAWIGRNVVALLGSAAPVQLGSVRIDLLDTGLTISFVGFLLWMSSRIGKEAPAATISPNADNSGKSAAPPGDYRAAPAAEALALGVAVGAASAMMGVGGAFLFIPIAIQRFGLPVTLVAGTSLFQLPLTAAVGAFFYGTSVDLPYIWLIPLLAGSTVGVTYGVRVSRRFSNDRLRLILGRVLMIVAALLTLSWLSGLR